jgi:ATP-dependent Lon protease
VDIVLRRRLNQVKISDKVLEAIIDKYTREAGVRDLDRQLAGIMRHVAKHVVMNEEYNVNITKEQLHKILGAERFDRDIFTEKQPAGVAIGLAWTSVGGDILFIEASLSKGNGALTLTGNLGDVMKESATTALSYIRAHANAIGVDVEDFGNWNVHIHVPEGAIPKDGPSAGITMLTALTSAFTGRAIKPYVAMTGEITLRGKVLPVGGIKEKILAAKRSGLKEIILCKTNQRDIAEIPAEYLEGIKFHYVERMEEVLNLALEPAVTQQLK